MSEYDIPKLDGTTESYRTLVDRLDYMAQLAESPWDDWLRTAALAIGSLLDALPQPTEESSGLYEPGDAE